MKTESSIIQSKESINLSKKSDKYSSVKKKFNNTSTNTFEKRYTLKNVNFMNTTPIPINLTEDLLRTRARSSSDKDNNENTKQKVNLNRELEDPDNQKIKSEIEKMIVVLNEMKQLGNNFEDLEKIKSYDDKSLDMTRNVEKDINIKYTYSSYLNGFKKIVDEYFKELDEEYMNHKLKPLNKRTSSELILTTLSNEKKHDLSSLETVYNLLGHEIYTKLIIIFEKYCYFGKSNSNFNMEYSQFSNFMTENNIHNNIITKIQSEMMFNKIKSSPKSVNFEEFLNILLEFSKLIFYWEKKPLNSLRYFINKFILNIPCLQKNEEEKIFDRWYFMLEYENISKETKRNLPFLYKIYKNYKQKDLRLGDCMDAINFMNFAKDYRLIPVFLSLKETNYIINFVRYTQKSLIPNNYFDFCAFVEIIALSSFFSYDKVNQDSKGQKQNVDITEKFKTFIKYLRDK